MRCRRCLLSRLDDAYSSEAGKILKAALDLRALIDAGIRVDRDELSAAETLALLIVKEEVARYEKEQADKNRQ